MLVALCTCCLFLASSAQEVTDSGTQSVTAGTQEVDWDTTARTTTTRGRYPNSRPNQDYAFENQWGPVATNQVANRPYGTRIQSPEAMDLRDILEYLPFLRRPDVVTVNVTRTGENYPQVPDVTSQPRGPEQLSYNPGLFYSRPDVAEILRYTAEADPIVRPSFEEEKQNISASSPPPFFLGAPSGRLDNTPGQHPYPAFGYLPPDYFYRRGGDRRFSNPFAVPSIVFNPTVVPRNEDGLPAYPQVDVFVRPPYIDRELGAEPAESILPPKEEAPAIVPNSLNSILPPVVPREQLPLPPFPYGLLPPGQAPPFPLPPRFLPPTLPPKLPPPSLPPVAQEPLLAGTIPSEPITPPVGLPNNPPLPPVLPQEVAKADGVSPPVIPPQETTPEVRIPYEFGYDMNDGRGTDQHRQEVSDGSGAVTGSYGYRDPMGVYRFVTYVADKDGFRAFIKTNEPGVANPGSADVAVMAEVPPLATIAEGLKQTRLEPVEVPDVPIDLVPEVAEIK